MKIGVFALAAFTTLVFIGYQQAYAVSITATPQTSAFGPNDWISVNIKVDGYNGGPVSWTAHRPNNSTISGSLTQVRQGGVVTQQIVRTAYDNQFGNWSIFYKYGDANTTAYFKVNPIVLTVQTDKSLYYEPDVMHANITTSYFVPIAHQAGYFHISFYDKKGNVVLDIPQADIRARQHSVIYNFHMIGLADYHPPGLYKLRVQYYNTVTDVPFLLGKYSDLMQITARTDKSTYKVGDAVNMDLVFTRVTQSNGTVKITDPSGKVTVRQFRLFSVHTSLVLGDITSIPGTYKYEIHYAGITQSASFGVVPNPKPLPNIKVSIFPDKLSYKPGETIHVKVSLSQVVANSTSIWVVDPNGVEYPRASFPTTAPDTILQHKIGKNATIGRWTLNIDYDGIVRSVPYSVTWPPLSYTEVLNANQFKIPVFVSDFGTNLTSPTAIAIDSDDNVYVADSGDSEIKKFDSNGNLLLSWGSHGTGEGQFIHPNGIAVGSKYVYVADSANARVQMFYKNGTFLYQYGGYGDRQGQFHSPSALALDERGYVFVADSDRDRIQIFDPHLVYSSEIKSQITQNGNFSAVNGIAFGPDGHFYVSTAENKILEFSNTFLFENSYGSSGSEEGRFNNPTAITLDSKGDFYVADTDNHRVQKFDPYGNFLLSLGSNGDSAGHFEEPVGLAVDSLDNLYVADKGSGDIQKFELYSPNAEIYTPAAPIQPVAPANATVPTPVPTQPVAPANVTVPTPVPTPAPTQPHAEDANVDPKEKSMVLDMIKQWKEGKLPK